MSYDGKYETLIDDSPVGRFHEATKDEKRKEMVLRYAKSMASQAWSMAFSAAHVPIVGSAFAIGSSVKSIRHAQRLNAIQNGKYECTCGVCATMIPYIVKQKREKAAKKIASAVPGVSYVVAAGSKVRFVYKKAKGTQGQDRLHSAVILWDTARNTCQKAKAIVYELFGGQEKGLKVLMSPTGYEDIARKLQST